MFSFSTASPPFCLPMRRAAFDGLGKSKERQMHVLSSHTVAHALPCGCTLPETGTSAQQYSIAVLWATLATTWEIRFAWICFWVTAWKSCLTHVQWHCCLPKRRTEGVQRKILLLAFHFYWLCVKTLPQGWAWKMLSFLCKFVHMSLCFFRLLAFLFLPM